MSENNDDFSRKFSKFADKAVKSVQSAGKTAWNRLDTEKQKAELKAQISSNQKELDSAYEKLGREYYLKETEGTPVADQDDLFEIVRSKTKAIELLKEKLDQTE